VTGIVREAVPLNPLGLIQFGLLLLIATPVLRVAFSVAPSPFKGTAPMSW
jgi:uncharacterized membrane protein